MIAQLVADTGNGENLLETGSSPVVGTNFIEENEDADFHRTDSAQKSGDFPHDKVRFPVRIKHRKADASIYGKTASYAPLPGRALRQQPKNHALVCFLRDSQGAGGNYGQGTGSRLRGFNPERRLEPRAVAAFDGLGGHFIATGTRLKLNSTLAQAVQAYRETLGTVKRKPLAEAVAEFNRECLRQQKLGWGFVVHS